MRCGCGGQAAYDTLDTALELAEDVAERCAVEVRTAAFDQAQARLALLEAEHARHLF